MTGKCRTPSSSIRSAASPTEVSGEIEAGSCVMYPATSVSCGSTPSATARTMSRSVTIPASRSPSKTGSALTSLYCIELAASASDSSARIVKTSGR